MFMKFLSKVLYNSELFHWLLYLPFLKLSWLCNSQLCCMFIIIASFLYLYVWHSVEIKLISSCPSLEAVRLIAILSTWGPAASIQSLMWLRALLAYTMSLSWKIIVFQLKSLLSYLNEFLNTLFLCGLYLGSLWAFRFNKFLYWFIT